MIEWIVCLLLVLGGFLVGHLATAIAYERRYGWLLERERDFQDVQRRTEVM